jgi:outer membrane receptor protein involved in Fe transport
MRAPTPVELTCADPDAPCRLPNNFLSDPPLQLVTARTLEAGARGKWGEAGKWSAAVYRTALGNDIQFVSSVAGAANAGYFRNVGRTRRQGIELAAGERAAAFEVEGRLSLVDATFQSPFLEASPNNSSSDASGAAQVLPGDRIPGIPQRSFKLRVEYVPGGAWSAGATLASYGPVFARGDENNRDSGGRIPGYALLHLSARWNVAPHTLVFAFVENVFDRRYASLGVLGRNFFTGPQRSFDGAQAVAEQFRGPGVPRGAWVGLRHEWR